MKKIIPLLIAAALTCGAAFADDPTVHSHVTGGTAPGIAQTDGIYLIDGLYDFALANYTSGDVEHIVTVPAGFHVLGATIGAEGLDVTTSFTVRSDAGDWTNSVATLSCNASSNNATTVDLSGYKASALKLGFSATTSTNMPTEGIFRLNVFGYDALPEAR